MIYKKAFFFVFMANVNNIDNRILAYPNIVNDGEERGAARELRENKNRARNGVEESASEEENLSLRQRVFAFKRAMKKNEDKGEGIKAKAEAPIKMGTNYLLRGAWINLLPSWGFSLIWINIHVFMRFVIPEIFCKLGREWMPKSAQAAGPGETASKTIGIGEVIALFFLDLIAWVFIFSAFALVVMIVDFLSA
ncbi:hypothetical protein DRH27_04880, partial [Candidatus Falkowbacteria bacterium]